MFHQFIALDSLLFVSYLRKSNNKFADQQIIGLEELVMYIEDRNLAPRDQVWLSTYTLHGT